VKRGVSRRTFLGYAVVSGGASFLAACGAPPPATTSGSTTAPPAPTTPSGAASTSPNYPIMNTPRGTFTWAGVQVGQNVDPHNQLPPVGDFPLRLAFDGLVTVSPTGQLLPVLATSWKSVDPTTWEFTLRPNVKFHSGRPFNAEAVKWNFERVGNPANRLQVTARIPTYESVQIVDAQTVRIKTKEPDPIFPRRAIVVLFADPVEGEKPTFSTNPGPDAGTGLFRYGDFDPGRSIVLNAATESWRGTPKIQRMVLRALPELGTVIAGLRSGDIDLSNMQADRVEDLLRAGMKVARTPESTIYQLWLRATPQGGPLADRRVRQALNYAIDKEAIIKELYAGAGKLTAQQVGEDGFGYNPDLRPYPYDPARARQLLAEAGYRNGFSIKGDILQGSLVLTPGAQGAFGFLKEVGIEVEQNPLEVNVYVARIFSGERNPIWMMGASYGPALDADFNLQWFSNKIQPPAAVMFDNQEFQRLFDASRSEFDEARRRRLLQDAQKVLHDEAAAVPLLQPIANWVTTPRVQNFVPHPAGAGYVNWQEVSVS
jgi:peptide/nickel transport system substrate-binding protein